MSMLELGFLLFATAVAAAVARAIVRFTTGTARAWALTGYALWLIHGGLLAATGVLADATRRPPGILFLLAPLLVWINVFSWTRLGETVAARVPLALLVGAQVFRVGVELFLDGLAGAGLIPAMMTYRGSNFDVLVGGSAPLVAWLVARQRIGPLALVLWNACGLLVLANVVVRGVLSVPGPLRVLHGPVANLGLLTFPFVYIPVLMVPLALTLHIAAIKAARKQTRAPEPGTGPARA